MISLERKIDAKVDGSDRITVNVKFFEKGNDVGGAEPVLVHEINHAYPLSFSKDDIEAEIDKAEGVFHVERERRKAQEITDQMCAQAEETAKKLSNFN